MRAFAYASGKIVFSRSPVPGTLQITTGEARRLRRAVETIARRAYDGETLLVPGLPEARTWEERCAALVLFQARVERALGRPALDRRIAKYEARRAA